VIGELRNYRGVSCVFCGRPISVSAKVVSLLPHAFVARCQICEHESVYEIKDLKRFDTEPPIRLAKARTVHLLLTRRAS
jgi:hypothetical protein